MPDDKESTDSRLRWTVLSIVLLILSGGIGTLASYWQQGAVRTLEQSTEAEFKLLRKESAEARTAITTEIKSEMRNMRAEIYSSRAEAHIDIRNDIHDLKNNMDQFRSIDAETRRDMLRTIEANLARVERRLDLLEQNYQLRSPRQ